MGLGLGDALAGLGLHHPDFLPKSLSTQKTLFFRRCRRGISEAHFRAFWRQALPGIMPAVNTVKNCCAERWAVVLSVLLLLWLARVLRGPCFFRVDFRAFWRARARDPSHKTLLFTVFCCFCVSGLACGLFFLGCCFCGLWRARARDPMSAFWVGARLGPRRLASPASSGVGTSHIIAPYKNMT